jgi:CheY-like chemotaxis protein
MDYSDSFLSNPDILGLNILLVDDNKVNQYLLKTALSYNYKCSIDTAENGIIAIDMFKNKDYDIIFMDIQMPDMDGYETTIEIRKIQAEMKRKVIIIAITANSMSGDIEKCLISGMDDYISKPIDLNILYQLVDKWNIKER